MRPKDPGAGGRVYRTTVRPALSYGVEATDQKASRAVGDSQMKMLKFTLGANKLDKSRNESIKGSPGLRRLGEKVREGRPR